MEGRGDKEERRDLRGGERWEKVGGEIGKREPSACVAFSLKARRPTRLSAATSEPVRNLQAKSTSSSGSGSSSEPSLMITL